MTYSWWVWVIEQWKVHRLVCLYHQRGADHEEVAVARLTVGRVLVKENWHVPTSPCPVKRLTLYMYCLLMAEPGIPCLAFLVRVDQGTLEDRYESYRNRCSPNPK